MRGDPESNRPLASPFTVRRIARTDDEDIPAIEQIARLAFEESAPFDAREELGRSWARIWCARLEGSDEIVGFLVGWHVADELHVLNVATLPAMRRRGVARALMNVVIAYATEHHVRILLLEVRRSNRPAIKLYRAFGFTALGVRARYYADNDEDAIEMILGLDPNTGHALPGKDEIRIDG